MRQIVVVATANASTDVAGLGQGSDQTAKVEKGQATKVVARGHQKRKESEKIDKEDRVARFIGVITAVHLVSVIVAVSKAVLSRDRTAREAKWRERVKIRAELGTEEDPDDSTEDTLEDREEVLEKIQILTIRKVEPTTKETKRMRVDKGVNLNVKADVVLTVVNLVLVVIRSKILMLKERIPTPAEVERVAKRWSLVKSIFFLLEMTSEREEGEGVRHLAAVNQLLVFFFLR